MSSDQQEEQVTSPAVAAPSTEASTTPAVPPETTTTTTTTDTKSKTPKRRPRRIIRRKKSTTSSTDIPLSITQNAALLTAISTSLPPDYDFEILKTIHRINQSQSHHIALQLPEGLLLYATTLADIFRTFCQSVQNVSILGDVTYGACCIDDLTAQSLKCDLLVHYGHSCLVPISETVVKCLYVFVEIRVDVVHAVDCVCETVGEGTEIFVMGIVQFRTAVVEAAKLLNSRNRPATIPQAKPLSPGEVLGCTSPTNLHPSTSNKPAIMLFFADGRFHLESAMISNPNLKAYRYDPYSKTLTHELYETEKMKRIRYQAIQSISTTPSKKTFGIILGTLGRQGNPSILSQIRKLLSKHSHTSFIILLSEIFPSKLAKMEDTVDAWIQIACPRLSVDWGHYFSKPVLSPYEVHVALGEVEYCGGGTDVYPMDFYRVGSGKWSNYHEENRNRKMMVGS